MLVLGLVMGCLNEQATGQSSAFPARGRVVCDGKPVAQALVVLHPMDDAQGARAFGRTDGDGNFVLSTRRLNDGAPAGRYAITVVLQDDADGTYLLPQRYADPATAGLSVIIKEGNNELPTLRLSRN